MRLHQKHTQNLKGSGDTRSQSLFLTAIANIRRLKEKASIKDHVQLNASFILYPENYSELYAAAKLAKDIGIKHFRIKQDISGGRLLSELQLHEVAKDCERIEDELTSDNFILVPIHPPEKRNTLGRNFTQCRITEIFAAVGSDGRLYPCNYHPRPGGLSYGNVVDNTFSSVWVSSLRRDLSKKCPAACPAVCDPFKMRANTLLEAIGAP